MADYDLIIIGAGPGGLTAGLYAARYGLKTLIVSKDIGGTANTIHLIENWPGFKGNGPELIKTFYDQVKEYDVEFLLNEVKKVRKEENFEVEVGDKKISSKAIILTTGAEKRKLFVRGEKDFLGKGVSYCATCDAFFYKDKIVAVVGGGDSAINSAQVLANVAKKVYLIYRGPEVKNLEQENIEIIYNAFLEEIKGNEKVDKIIIEKDKEKNELEVEGIFIEEGSSPLTEFLGDLDLEKDGDYIKVDENMKTSIKGFFAAGDVTNQRLKQVVVAAGQGAIAAKSAYDYVKSSK